jgi:hypothetical protein
LVQQRWKEAVYLLIAETFIGVNFTVILNSSLKGMIDNPEMENLWQGALWNGNVLSFEALKWVPKVIYDSIVSPCGLGFPILVMLLVVMGALAWGSRSRRDMALFAFPIVLAFAAALFGKYPFQGRAILFLVPAYYLFLSQGLDFIAQRFLKIKGVLLVVMLLLVFMKPVQEAVFFLSGNRPDTYSHELLKYFGDHYLPGDAIFVTVDTKYSFWYYAGSLGYGKRFVKEPCCRKDQRILEGIKIGLFSIDPIKYVGDSSYKAFVLEKMKKIMFLYQYDVFDEQGNFKGSFIHEDERTYSVSADGNNQYPHSWLFLNKHEDAKRNEGLNIIVASFRKEGKEIFNMERPSRVLYLFDMDQRQPPEAAGSSVNLINFQVPAS